MAAHTYAIVTKPAVCRRTNCNAKALKINGDGQQVISCPIDESHCTDLFITLYNFPTIMTRTVCDSILRNTGNDVNVHKVYCEGSA